jgi:hypothetical protein
VVWVGVPKAFQITVMVRVSVSSIAPLSGEPFSPSPELYHARFRLIYLPTRSLGSPGAGAPLVRAIGAGLRPRRAWGGAG